MLEPLPASKWNFSTAAHLLNRAGFGGSPEEIEKLAALGLEGAVASLVDYERIPDPAVKPGWAQPDPERATRFQAMRKASPEERRELQRMEQRKQRERITELRQWWLHRMATGPRPLQEKLTLFWHGHFATSTEKVRDAYLMWRQNEIFRQHASGSWLKLLTEVSKDPAMLVWLDQAQSRKEHPNENFAREVMELFALGEGHYTEQDILEAARALTGWTYDRMQQEFVYRDRLHDPGVKTVLGRSGRLTGDDVLAQIVSQPQSARFITAKLWSFFAAENPPEPLSNALAGAFTRSGMQFKPVLRQMFLSREFYADNVVRNQVKSPVQWLVSAVRMLERELPPAAISTNMTRALGQDLFAPPNVKGWDGGLTWITTNNLLNRYNLAAVLVLGENPLRMTSNRPNVRPAMNRRDRRDGRPNPQVIAPIDVAKILTPPERRDKMKLVAALEKRLLQAPLKEKQEKALLDYLDSQGQLDDKDILHAIRLVMSTPEFQLT
ncbi:MAG: DUF1800 domain-containing protein [Verrucomicrobiota bacterium]